MTTPLHRRLALLAICAAMVPTTLTADEKTKKEAVAESEKKPQAKPLVLFDGKSMKGWRVIKKFDFEKHGKVSLDKGAMQLEKGAPATGVVWTGEMPRMNYEVTLEAKRVKGGDFFCGLTFPVDKTFCSLIIGGWGGGVTGLSNIDGSSAVENETTGYTDFKQNKWYRVRLRVTPTKIEAWIDKEQIVDVETKKRKFSIWWEQEPVRPLGVATWNTTSALRDIKLLDLSVKKGDKQTKGESEEDPKKK